MGKHRVNQNLYKLCTTRGHWQRGEGQLEIYFLVNFCTVARKKLEFILFYFICGEIFAILQKGILNFFLKKNCHLYTVFLEKKSPKYEFLNFLKKITQNHKQFPTIIWKGP